MLKKISDTTLDLSQSAEKNFTMKSTKEDFEKMEKIEKIKISKNQNFKKFQKIFFFPECFSAKSIDQKSTKIYIDFDCNFSPWKGEKMN